MPFSAQEQVFVDSQSKAANELREDTRVNNDEVVFYLLSSSLAFGINSDMGEFLEQSYGVWKQTAKDLGEPCEEVLSSK